MAQRFLLAVLLGVGLMGLPAHAADTPADSKQAAVASAETWLNLLDTGDYNQTWDTAASYLKGVVTKPVWEQTVAGVRQPLGKAVSRQILSQEEKTSLPGAPDGQYVVIQYQTSFENKKDAVETITPMLDKDGVWRVSGYFVR